MTLFKLVSIVFVVGLLSLPALAQGSAKVVKISPGEPSYQVKRGASTQIAVNIQIDDGYHINSNRPAEKYLIATSLKLDRAHGLTTTPVIYPRSRLQKFGFSQKPLSVFEGKAVLKFTAHALSSASVGSHALTGKLTVQACNNQQCLR